MLPLRILHVAPYSERAWAYGGIPRVLAALARAQARAGHLVTVATTDVHDGASRLAAPGKEPRPRRRPWRERSDEGIDEVVFPNVSNRLASRWQFYQPIGIARFLRRHAVDFDVAHLHACHNLPTALAARALRRAGVPYVMQPNGTAARIEQRRAAKWLFDFLFARHLLRDAASVVAVSEWERRQLEAAGVGPARCRIVPNPLAPAPAPMPPGAFRRRLGLTADPMVLFLGVLSPRKHPAVLAEAVAALAPRPVQLVFAGADRGAATAARRAAHRLGIAPRTHFVGVLPGADRFDALADADVAVYASSDEAFGLSALEALQAGTPVVVGGEGGCGEIIAAVGGGTLVGPGDPRPLAAALDELIRDLPAWKAAARAAGVTASRRFHPDAVWAELEPVYQAAVHPLAAA